MKSYFSPEFNRNYGFWNEDEQRLLMSSRVAIGGVGGDGYQLGLKLARMGVSAFNVADPEVFERENANRVPGATNSTYGRLKASVFADEVHDINPDADVEIFTDGVTPENADDFVHNADLVFDETELTYLAVGTALARAARKHDIPDVMVMNIGFAAQITSFNPRSRYTFEKFMGIPKEMPLDEVSEMTVDLARCVPYIPSYGDIDTLRSVEGGASLPSIAQGVDIASAIGASQGLLHLVKGKNNRREPVWAPRIAYIDAYNLSSGITRFPRSSHYRHLALMAVRGAMGKNPKASYSEDDILRRELLAKK